MDERKTAILSLIAGQPDIRLVEISDKLDIDPERVQPIIQEEINAGHIVVSEIRAPNGRMQPCFRYKSFIGSLKPAESQADIDVPVTRKLDVPLISKPAPERCAMPAKVKPAMSKIELAIEHLRNNTNVTTEQLRAAIGLTAKDPVGSYIRLAIRDGRIKQVNGIWSLGPGREESRAEQPAAGINIDAAHAQPGSAAVQPLPISPTIPMVSPTPAATAAQPPAEDKPALPSHDAERFVAGLLSNGELQLSIDGKTLTLPPAQTRELYQYLNKIGPVMLA